jgi:hypothetical protein
MVFKKKKIEEKIVEEVKEVESPTAEEMICEADDETISDGPEEPATAKDLDNQLNAVLNDLNNRIQSLEAFNFRLKNI